MIKLTPVTRLFGMALLLFSVLSLACSSSGMLDTTFGRANGIVLTEMGAGNGLTALHVLADDSILAAGALNNFFTLMHYTSNGSLDTDFGIGGVIFLDLPGATDGAEAMLVQGDGKIVLAGYTDDSIALARYTPEGLLDPNFDGDGILTTTVGLSATAYGLALDNSDRIVAAGGSSNGGNEWFTLLRYEASGALDPSFNASGVITTSIGISSSGRAHTVLVQADDSLVAVGHSSSSAVTETITLVRYDNSGALDLTFGVGGIVTTTIGGGDTYAYAALQQPDNKILVAGEWLDNLNGLYAFALARYNEDGVLDPSFGVGGIVTTTVSGSDATAFALALQPDGKIILSGKWLDSVETLYNFALVRYNDDGSLDTSFGPNLDGTLTTVVGQADAASYAIGLQSDGKIIAGGFGNQSFALVRYGSDGQVDAAFGPNGWTTTSFNSSEAAAVALTLQPDGKILTGGYVFDDIEGAYDFALARYDNSGELDAGFGSGGTVLTNFGYDAFAAATDDDLYGIALQPDGKILAAGGSYNGLDYFALARYESGGSLDPGFGFGGLVTTSVTTTVSGLGGHAHAVLVQPDDKIIAAGHSIETFSETFTLARYDASGILDAGFGAGGIVTTTFPGGEAYAYAAALQPDGKILLAGEWRNGANLYHFALARYEISGILDTGFGVGGIVTTTIPGGDASAYAMLLQADGRIVLAGEWYDSSASEYYPTLARYNDDGSLDTSFGPSFDGIYVNDSLPAGASAYAIAQQADGKYILASSIGLGPSIITRYNYTNGDQDLTFGALGIASSLFGLNGTYLNAVAIQPNDGRIVVAGELISSVSGESAFIVARHNVAEIVAEEVTDGGVSTLLPGVEITNNSGVACTFQVMRNPVPPGGGAPEVGEMPVQWRIQTIPNPSDGVNCGLAPLDLNLTFLYDADQLAFSNNVDESTLKVFKYVGDAWVDQCASSCDSTTPGQVTIYNIDTLSNWAIGDMDTPGNAAPNALRYLDFQARPAAASSAPWLALLALAGLLSLRLRRR